MIHKILNAFLGFLSPPNDPETPSHDLDVPTQKVQEKHQISEDEIRLSVKKVVESSHGEQEGTLSLDEEELQDPKSELDPEIISALVDEVIANGLCLSIIYMLSGKKKCSTHYLMPMECRKMFFKAIDLKTGKEAAFAFSNVKMVTFAPFEFMEEVAGGSNILLKHPHGGKN